MVNVNKLKGRLVENNTTVEEMAKVLGISPSTIYRKLQSNGDTFTIGEANGIVKFLRLSPEEATAIFLARLSHKCDMQTNG